MKTAAKVFLILTIVSCAALVLMGLIFTVVGIVAFNAPISGGEVNINGEVITDPDIQRLVLGTTFLIFGISFVVFGAISLIVSIVGLKKLNNATRASDISTGFKVVVLLFSNLISGIIMLCMTDKDYLPKGAPVVTAQPASQNNDLEQISKLKKLLDMGAITQEEFDYKKAKILGETQSTEDPLTF
ncbi:MAG: SHOCT domain-containing protein [Clostridia bacterium]|nr:SHOCT domain-containing protein [Clostridia bacterium]